jgi:FPC/CPF motif-containing protein YcgG
MSKSIRRRLEHLETVSLAPDLRRYEGVPFNEWPDWALRAFLGDPTDEQLAAMIAELEAMVTDETRTRTSS